MTENKQSLQSDSLKNFKRVDEEKRQAWVKGLSKLKNDLSQTASTYVSDQRVRSAKIAELSHTRMLG